MNKEKYHLIIDLSPDDCMGERINDIPFASLEEAISMYDSFTHNKEYAASLINEVFPSPEWLNNYSSKELSESGEEPDSLYVSGYIGVFECEEDFIEWSKRNTRSTLEDFKYSTWINAFDDIWIDDKFDCSIKNIYEEISSKKIKETYYEFFITPSDIKYVLKDNEKYDLSFKWL